MKSTDNRKKAVNLAMKDSKVGKKTVKNIYVHRSAITLLPRALKELIWKAEEWNGEGEGNVIKVSTRDAVTVSFLTYEDFKTTAHPTLLKSVTVAFRAGTATPIVRTRDYLRSENRPILHRKEQMVAEDFAGRKKFLRLTVQEVNAGLLGVSTIGREKGWNDMLRRKGMQVIGHKLST